MNRCEMTASARVATLIECFTGERTSHLLRQSFRRFSQWTECYILGTPPLVELLPPPAHCPSILSSPHLVVSQKRNEKEKGDVSLQSAQPRGAESGRTTPIFPVTPQIRRGTRYHTSPVSGTSRRACHGANARRSHRAKEPPLCLGGLNGLGVTQRSQPSGRGGWGSRGLFVSHGNRASAAVGGWFVLVLLGRAVEVHACGAGATALGVGGLDCCSSGACVCVCLYGVHWYWLRAVYRDGSEGLAPG